MYLEKFVKCELEISQQTISRWTSFTYFVVKARHLTPWPNSVWRTSFLCWSRLQCNFAAHLFFYYKSWFTAQICKYIFTSFFVVFGLILHCLCIVFFSLGNWELSFVLKLYTEFFKFQIHVRMIKIIWIHLYSTGRVFPSGKLLSALLHFCTVLSVDFYC